MRGPVVTSKNSNAQAWTKKVIVSPLGPIARYHLTYAFLLSLAPIVSFGVMTMLLSIFARLNLYFLEANGLILDSQVREAYYRQVEAQVLEVSGYFILQLFVTAIASYLVMRWASAPFRGAQAQIETALTNPEALRPRSRWLSESPDFDRLVWDFSLRIKNRTPHEPSKQVPAYATNISFLAKFLLAFGTLSVLTGSVLSIFLDAIYLRIVGLALQFVPAGKVKGHYFLEQQELMQDVTWLLTGTSLLYYLVLGIVISRYMGTMIWVFSRSLAEDRFPVTIRHTDIYPTLAQTMNDARAKL